MGKGEDFLIGGNVHHVILGAIICNGGSLFSSHLTLTGPFRRVSVGCPENKLPLMQTDCI